MSLFHFAALLTIIATPLQAQTIASKTSIQLGNGDSVEQRQALQNLSGCLAEVRPRWARKILSYPYLSKEQASEAAQALDGKDNCLREAKAELVFRTSSIVSGLAEYFLQEDMKQIDFARLSSALSTVDALNVSEDFGLCLAARNPVAARDLALSVLGSEAEKQTAERLAIHIQDCVNVGEQPTVDLQALRALVATALYRGIAAIKPGA